MRKAVAAIFLLCAVSRVSAQVPVSQDCGAVPTCTISVIVPNAGDLVVVAVRAGGNPTVAVTGFAKAGQVTSIDPHVLALFFTIAAASGPLPINVTATDAASIRVDAATFAGPWDGTTFPLFASATDSSAAPSSGACDPKADLCVGAVATANAAVPTALSGEQFITSAGSKVFLYSGPAAAKATLATSDLWSAISASFYRPKTSIALSATLLWDDNSPITGIVQVQQMQGTTNAVLASFPLDAQGSFSGPITMDLTQPDPLSLQFNLIDASGNAAGSVKEVVPKAMFAGVTKAVASLTVARASMTLKGIAWASQ